MGSYYYITKDLIGECGVVQSVGGEGMVRAVSTVRDRTELKKLNLIPV